MKIIKNIKNIIIKSNVWFDNLNEITRLFMFLNIWIIGSLSFIFLIDKYGIVIWLCLFMFWRMIYIFHKKDNNVKI